MKKVYIALSCALCIATGALYSMDPAYKKILQGKGGSELVSKTFIEAAQQGNLAQIKEAIEELGVNINYQSPSDGNTALMEAVKNRHPEVIDYLLGQEAAVDIKNNTGKSALDVAVENQDQAMVNKLLDAAE